MRASVASRFARNGPTAAAIGYAAVTASGRQGARCGKACHPARAICLTDTAASRAQGGSGADYSRPNANRGVCFAKLAACRGAKTMSASQACPDAGSLVHLVARLKPADVRRNGYARLCRTSGRQDRWARRWASRGSPWRRGPVPNEWRAPRALRSLRQLRSPRDRRADLSPVRPRG